MFLFLIDPLICSSHYVMSIASVDPECRLTTVISNTSLQVGGVGPSQQTQSDNLVLESTKSDSNKMLLSI